MHPCAPALACCALALAHGACCASVMECRILQNSAEFCSASALRALRSAHILTTTVHHSICCPTTPSDPLEALRLRAHVYMAAYWPCHSAESRSTNGGCGFGRHSGPHRRTGTPPASGGISVARSARSDTPLFAVFASDDLFASPAISHDLPRYCRILQNAVHFRCSAAFSRFHHSKATLPTPFSPLCGAGVAWDHRKRPMGSIAALPNIILHAGS